MKGSPFFANRFPCIVFCGFLLFFRGHLSSFSIFSPTEGNNGGFLFHDRQDAGIMDLILNDSAGSPGPSEVCIAVEKT